MNMKMVLSLVAVAVISGGGGYLTGSIISRSAAESSAKTAAEATKSRNDRAQAELVRALAGKHVLRANLLVYQALAALDERNFGIANDAMKAAASELEAAASKLSTVDQAVLAPLLRDARETQVSVAMDLEQQRRHILMLAGEIDASGLAR